MTEKPNYYAVLPAKVRYDTNLSSLCKLMYAEISALSNLKGKCWATNKYFATLYEVTPRTISRMISQLKEHGHIIVEDTKLSPTKTIRYLVLANAEDFGGGNDKIPSYPDDQALDNNVLPPHDKNVYTPLDNNVVQNNTRVNTTSNNNKRTNDEFQTFWKALKGRKKNKNDALKVYLKIDTELSAEELSSKYNSLLKTREEKFVPYPHRWLKNESWTEEVESNLSDFQKGRMFPQEQNGHLTDKNFPNEEYFQDTINHHIKRGDAELVMYYKTEHTKWKKEQKQGKI